MLIEELAIIFALDINKGLLETIDLIVFFC
jgi:hypothetical protein